MRDKAIDLMKIGNFQDALALFNMLLVDNVNDWNLLYMAGQCARFTNDFPLAVKYLTRASELNHNEPQIFLALGKALQLFDQLIESEHAFRKALELNGNMDSAYNSLGLTHKRMGKLDLALHNLEEGLKAISRRIARTMTNQRESRILDHPAILGKRWTQVAINCAMYLCVMDGNISRLAWPTSQQAMHEAKI